MTAYTDWRNTVLAALAAPHSDQNAALLDGWARAESPADNLMRWNNPLNTTEKVTGSWNSGAQPGPNDVQVYPSALTGAAATVATLTNGLYNAIVSGLQASQPPAWYQRHAAADFATWGTGAAFLATVPTVYTPPIVKVRRAIWNGQQHIVALRADGWLGQWYDYGQPPELILAADTPIVVDFDLELTPTQVLIAAIREDGEVISLYQNIGSPGWARQTLPG